MNAFTIVMINVGSASKTIALVGDGLPADFQAFRTSAREDTVALGTVAAGEISLPASSITTFVNGSYREIEGGGGTGGSGGAPGTGGATGSGGRGGATGTAGRTSSGGASAMGGVTGTGGRAGSGGATGSGGRAGSGGVGTTGGSGSGCSCRMGGGGSAGFPWWALLVATIAILAARRHRRGTPRRKSVPARWQPGGP